MGDELSAGIPEIEGDAAQGRLVEGRYGHLDRPRGRGRRRLDPPDGDAFDVIAEDDLEGAAVERRTGAVRQRQPEPRRLAAPPGEAVPLRHDHGVRVDDVEQLVEDARVAAHVEQAVRLPMAVVQLRDHVAGEVRLPPHRLDLVLERAELLPLGRDDEAAQVPEHAVEAPIGEAVLDPMGIHDALAPVVPGLEPPGLLAVAVPQILRIGQAPVAEFRAHERLAPGDHRVAVGRVEPGGARRELVHEPVPVFAMVRDGGVEVVVGDVRFHMEARRQRRVVDDEAQGVVGLQPGEGALQPVAMVGIVDEVDAPILIDDRPDDDRRVIHVAVDDAFEELLLAAAGAVGRHAAVRQFRPDEHADPVRDLVIARVRRLDVAAQAVEPEFLRLPELVFQELHGRDRADRVRVIVLVQGAAEVDRLAVEVERCRSASRSCGSRTCPRRRPRPRSRTSSSRMR